MRWTLLVGVLLAFGLPALALAHGVDITYEARTATVVELTATFDTGEPMAGGQVAVYAPDNPADPWLTGTCDEEGRFTFTPDPALPGTWEVQVRQSGHGDVLYIPVGAQSAESGVVSQVTAGSSGYTTLQLVLMGGAVVWGFLGTALFFSNRRG